MPRWVAIARCGCSSKRNIRNAVRIRSGIASRAASIWFSRSRAISARSASGSSSARGWESNQAMVARAAAKPRYPSVGRQIRRDPVKIGGRLGHRPGGKLVEPQPHVLQGVLGILPIAQTGDQKPHQHRPFVQEDRPQPAFGHAVPVETDLLPNRPSPKTSGRRSSNVGDREISQCRGFTWPNLGDRVPRTHPGAGVAHDQMEGLRVIEEPGEQGSMVAGPPPERRGAISPIAGGRAMKDSPYRTAVQVAR